MADAIRSPDKPFRPQFTLRRMLAAILMLSIALGVGRWVYVRTILQRQIVVELQAMEVQFEYMWLTDTRQAPHHRWFGTDPVLPGYAVSAVIFNVPFRSNAEARRANQLLRQLPHLRAANIQCSFTNYRMANGRYGAHVHAATALRGLRVDELIYAVPEPDTQIASVIRQSSHLRKVDLFLGPPSEANLRVICESPQLETLWIGNGVLTAEHLEVLAAASQLKVIGLGGRLPFDRLGALGKLEHCELKINARHASDRDLKDVVATLPNLTELSLFLNEPADDALMALADSPRLRVLSLQDAVISDAAVIALARSQSLEHVDLAGTEVSDEAIVNLARCPTLRLIKVVDFDARQRLQRLVPATVKVGIGYSSRHAKAKQAQSKANQSAQP